MTLEIALVFALLIAALVVFALDLFPIDFVAFGIMAAMLVLAPVVGLTPRDAISGFSNPATITVLAMFILSGGIYRTGVVNELGHRAIRMAGGSEMRQLLVVMLIVGPTSAFINNTAAVAILIPLVTTMAREQNRAPSKLLIPLSYTSQLAGVITLIGTSTNILASELAAEAGRSGCEVCHAFGLFEFAPIGLLIFVVGAVYLLGVGQRLLPERRMEREITERYEVTEYLSEVVVLRGSELVGRTLVEARLSERFDVQVLEIIREGQKLGPALSNRVLQPGDILFIRAGSDQLLAIKDAVQGLAIEPEVRLGDQALAGDELGLLEVVVAPNASLIGGTLESTNFRNRFNATVIAMQKHGAFIRERLGKVRLDFGDTLLVQGEKRSLEQFKRHPDFIVTEELQPEAFRREKMPIALAIVGGVVLVAALGVPILVTAMVGCVLMVLTGCLSVTELHESIRWDVIFLLAGVIPLGLAMEQTGGAELLAQMVAGSAEHVAPIVVLMAFYVISMLLTGVISNNATVVVLVPVGVATAQTLGLNPQAFILAIMFAASTSFWTPVGYQTNTMVYGPGGYKFLDFVKVGGPLNIILAVLTPIFIYLIWGL
ncbi:MAG: SLC13 family permease [Candidatus Bipolaricaulia bacterium]